MSPIRMFCVQKSCCWTVSSSGVRAERVIVLKNKRVTVLQVNRCLSIKGAEDILNKPHAFEVSTTDDSMFFIADTDKVRLPA